MHTMREAVRPGDNTDTRGLDLSSLGYLCLADDSLSFNSPRPQSPSGYNRMSLFGGWKQGSSGGLQSGDFDSAMTSSMTSSGYKMKKFLRTQSSLKMLWGKQEEMTSCKALNDYLTPRDTVLEHLSLSRFSFAAKNYKLYGTGSDTFSDICHHNSNVALEAGMANAARTWLLLSQFYSNSANTCSACNDIANATSIPRTFSDVAADRARKGDGDSKRTSIVSKKVRNFFSDFDYWFLLKVFKFLIKGCVLTSQVN